MKKYFTLFSIFLACSLLSTNLQAQAVTNWGYQYVQADTQPLYRNLEDTIYSKPMLKLRKGDRLLVVEKMGNWVVVRVGSKMDFYTMASTLSITPPNVSLPAEAVKPTPERQITLEDLDPKKRTRAKISSL